MVHPAMKDWYEEHVAKPARERNAAVTKRRCEAVASLERTPPTELDKAAIVALGKCRYGCGTFDKRFARDIQGATELTGRQRLTVWSNAWSYRRQIADVTVLAEAKRLHDELETAP